MKKYKCKNKKCKNTICYGNFLRGSGLCRKCAGRIHSKRMEGENNPAKRPEVRKKIISKQSGKKSHFYKDGRCLKKYYCIDCGERVTRKSILGRCGSCSQKGNLSSSWVEDRSIVKYGYRNEFNNELKEKIRKRDKYKCRNCKLSEKKHIIIYGRKLHVHHIDYNKRDNLSKNLISLCTNCHSKTNHNRKYWKLILTGEK